MRINELLSEDADDDYKIAHQAPTHDSGSPLHDLSATYPDEIYGPKAAEYYGHYGGGNMQDRKAISIIQSRRNKPSQGTQIFRAVPADVKSNKINPGDWVTINRDYAVEHGHGLGKYKILSKIVSAKHLYTNGDSIQEWGYDPT